LSAVESTPDPGLQKINVKLFLDAPPGFESDFLLEIFGRWRLETGEEIVDLADYAHVEDGPGCLLISHRWHFGIDFAKGRPGLYYATRKGLSGGPYERFLQALAGLAQKSGRLLGEKEFPGSVKPRCGELEIVLNDRLLAPNTDPVDKELRPGLEKVIQKLYGPGAARVERERDPGRRLGYTIEAPSGNKLSFEEFAGRLA